MNGLEQIIIQLAEKYKEPYGFIYALENSFEVPQNEKGKFFLQIGALLFKFSYFSLALHSWDYALNYFVKNGDKAGSSTCYTSLATAYQCLGDFKKAIEYHEKSLHIAKEIRNRLLEAACYGELGNVYRNLGDFKKAIEYHEKSLYIAKEIRNRLLEAACYGNLGNVFSNSGGFEKAIEYFEKFLKIAVEIGDRAGVSKCLTNLGGVYYYLGDFKKAIEYHEKSLQIAKGVGDRYSELRCYGNLGDAFGSLGDFKKAIEYHEKSIKISREIGDKPGELACYTSVGGAYHSLGEFRKAIECYEKSLQISREIGDKPGESRCYVNLGNAYWSVGVFEKAIEYYEKSLHTNKKVGDRLLESRCYVNLGNVYGDLGDFKKAIEYHEKSLQINKEAGSISGESVCYANLGNVFSELKEFRKAVECYEKSLQISREIGDKAAESICYENIGSVYRYLGDFKKTIEYYDKSLEIAKEIGEIEVERSINLNFGLLYYKSKPKISYNYFKRSIKLSEIIGGNLVEEEHKIGFFARAIDAYKHIVSLCLELEKEEEAFEYIEMSKSRAFLDMLAAAEVRPTVEITSELQLLLNNEEKNLAKLRAIQTRHLRPAKTPVEPGEVEQIHEKLTQIYKKIEKYDPEYVYVRKAKPLSLDNMQNMLSLQKRDVVLIEYFITENKAIIFVISSKDGKFHIKTVPLSQKDLNKYTENYQIKMAYCSSFQHIGKKSLELGKHLIEPVSDYLAKGDLIYFVPYGPLHYFPLHAVELNGEPLIKRHPIVYAPSASIIKFCQSKGSNKLKSCASFGVDPDPYERIKEAVEKEAEKIAGLFNGTSYIDCQVTKSTVLKKCLDKDVIHFACHGKFVNADPLSSGVVLHNEAILTAREIFDMRLTTELVTLSACQTGINKRSPGDELIGLTRAFLYAGAPSVIVSLWLVDSPSTYELMLEFYRLLKKGTDKATALQKAQIKIMEEKEYTNPYYWAPFVLIGDWQ